MLSSTISEQAFLLSLARAAEVKVQDEALFDWLAGEGAGAADTSAVPSASRETKEARMVNKEEVENG